ncbi:hypothetical protein C2845_PM03G17380 [Panicum miliaceum]|uniref:Uncharacterized protein n=1 Tax=Panicum miliaceum TaxID=4540 RepID=A0A3L6T6K7_PANMI|nr:hypothetical protein C2845_PM03G17380 [Panicum miliaceum]
MAADPSPPASALMQELVEEVLLRFPLADPSRLVGAALVTGAVFRRRFRELHHAPPLLGLLCNAGPRARCPRLRLLPARAPRQRPPPRLARATASSSSACHGRVLLRAGPSAAAPSTPAGAKLARPVWRADPGRESAAAGGRREGRPPRRGGRRSIRGVGRERERGRGRGMGREGAGEVKEREKI